MSILEDMRESTGCDFVSGNNREELQPTDWSLAPAWAMYRAVDSDGFWGWYELEPVKTSIDWELSNQESNYCPGGVVNLVGLDWENSLEKRVINRDAQDKQDKGEGK